MQPISSSLNDETQLPAAVVTYFQADRANDLELLATCFTPEAQVRDEREQHLGLKAIIEWKRSAQGKYQYTVEPLQAVVDGDIARVAGRVSGNFPGSPIEMTYRFELENGKIALMEVE